MASAIPYSLLQALQRQKRSVAAPPSVEVSEPFRRRVLPADLERFQEHNPSPDMERYGERYQPSVAGALPESIAAAPSRAVPLEGVDDVEPIRYAESRPRVVTPPEIARFSQPREEIEANDAPLDYSRLSRPNLQSDVINEGLSSADPRMMRTAMEARREAEGDKPRGFWQKVGRRFKGIGEGALEGLIRGGGAGAVIGGIAGGISPKYADKLSDEREFARRYPENVAGENVRYRQVQADRQHQAELRQQANYERQARATEAQIENQNRDDLYRRTKDERDAGEKSKADIYKRDQDLINNRQQITREGATRLSMPDLFTPRLGADKKPLGNAGEVVQIGPQDVYRRPSIEQEQQRKLDLAEATGSARVANQVEAQRALAPGKILEGDVAEERAMRREDRRERERERRDEEKAETARVKEAKTVHAKVQAIINRAAKLDEEAKGLQGDPEKYDAKRASAQGDWDSARREAEIAAQAYPDLLEVGGLGEGEYPYVKLKEVKVSRGSAKSSSGGGTLSKAEYDALVEKHGKTRADAFVAAKGLKIQ